MKYLPYIFPKKRGAPRKRHLFSYSLLFYLNWNWLRPEGLSFSSRRPSFILWASVLEMDFFSLDHRITDQSLAVQIFSMHIHCADLMVFVGIIIIDSLCHITAGSIQCDLILSISNFTASPLLIHWTENMEKLADTFRQNSGLPYRVLFHWSHHNITDNLPSHEPCHGIFHWLTIYGMTYMIKFFIFDGFQDQKPYHASMNGFLPLWPWHHNMISYSTQKNRAWKINFILILE